MMSINSYISDAQDPKIVEKYWGKILDMLTKGEQITYIAVQKKPGITLLATCILLTNKRLFICKPSKLGLTTNYLSLDWKDVKTITFNEAFIGSKFIIEPMHGEAITIAYIPKVQGRKLYKYAKEGMECYPNLLSQKSGNAFDVLTTNEPEGSLDERLQHLKELFDKQLISLQEYEQKKEELLRQL